jgi:hypothetical protein
MTTATTRLGGNGRPGRSRVTPGLTRVAPGPPEPGDVLTVGRCAILLHVSHRSVAKWIDGGLLPGYTLPASKDRRVHAADLEVFMLAQGMFREVATASVARDGKLYLARVHDRWGRLVARVAPVGAPAGSGVDWRPWGAARYEVKAASDDDFLVLVDGGFAFHDGR